MSKKLHNIKKSLNEDLSEIIERHVPDYSSFRILRKSVDARKRHDLKEVYSLEVFENGEEAITDHFPVDSLNSFKGQKPIIVGSGPAGLFCALRLVERGIPCILLERGSECSKRMLKINRYWRYGEISEDDNVCFGEGGAGLYSDGKLITRIKSDYIPYVMDRLIQFGAPEEIRYLANPHVGSDRIRRVIPKMRAYLQEKGCEIHFNSKVESLIFNNETVNGVISSDGRKFLSDHVVLATGHSANDMFHHLKDSNVHLEGKSFAMGLRVEHPQKLINKIQYRQHAEHPSLGSANYKLTYNNKEDNFGVYSFCMCPGGYVLSSGTESTGIVSNGMSNYNRNSPWANAAVVVTFDYEKHFGNELFSGLDFRTKLEEKSLHAVQKSGGDKQLPGQRVVDFLENKKGELTKSSCPSGLASVNLNELLPTYMSESLKEGLTSFHQKMQGFAGEEAQLIGVETRTSCPIRVTRDVDSLESISHSGLYPTGEGAGYAGGITSAAIDGIKVAEKIYSKYKP
ncbi:MAG: NAD(P)/FAD-dependent oxidoreductase [Bdellovibrionales bacterium]